MDSTDKIIEKATIRVINPVTPIYETNEVRIAVTVTSIKDVLLPRPVDWSVSIAPQRGADRKHHVYWCEPFGVQHFHHEDDWQTLVIRWDNDTCAAIPAEVVAEVEDLAKDFINNAIDAQDRAYNNSLGLTISVGNEIDVRTAESCLTEGHRVFVWDEEITNSKYATSLASDGIKIRVSHGSVDENYIGGGARSWVCDTCDKYINEPVLNTYDD